MALSKNTQLMVAELLKEANKKAEELISSAKKEAATTLHAAKFTAREEEEKDMRNVKAESKRAADEVLAKGKLQAKKEALQRREEMISNIFKEAEKGLEKFVKLEVYKKSLGKRAAAACKKLGSPDVVIMANRRDLQELKKSEKEIVKALGGKASVAFGGPIQAIGGVLVKSADGKVEVDETFDGRMKRELDDIRVKVAKIIFEGSR
ncbi:MAG: V-type ATP synthase subunit E family protein [Candidatus Hadarchaeota archaeon]